MNLAYFPFFPADYLGDEKVKLMSLTAEGAYLRLLCHQWAEGSIPANRSAIVLLCKNHDGPHIDEVLSCFFPSGKPDRLINPRLDRERRKLIKAYNSKKKAGLHGAKKRWQTHSTTNGKPIAKDGYSDSDSDTDIEEKNKASMSGKVVEIIDYLNTRTGKKFKATAEATIKLIKGRLAEGRTLEDFKHVIDVKAAKWLGDPKMDDFLRPDTLFRPSNFESYLNERLIPSRDTRGTYVGAHKEPALTAEQQLARAEKLKALTDEIDAEFRPKAVAARQAGDLALLRQLQKSRDQTWEARAAEIFHVAEARP